MMKDDPLIVLNLPTRKTADPGGFTAKLFQKFKG